MESNILQLYNLTASNIEENEGVYTFESNFYQFFYVPFLRPEKDIDDLVDISEEMAVKGLLTHKIIKNSKGNYLTNFNDKLYILLLIVKDNSTLDIYDIDQYMRNLQLNTNKKNIFRVDWPSLWESKVDYYEYQMSKLGKDKKIILSTMSYYLGLAENAIAYASETVNTEKISSNDRITICHRRVYYPNYELNYYNPLAYVIDLEVRDIAEYIKSYYFNNEDYNEIYQYLDNKILSVYSCRMLFARLLYPSYYFDQYDKIMNSDDDEEKIIAIVEKATNYESFLNNIFTLLNKKNPMPKVAWITKN